MRPIWTGIISFGLINIPVNLYAAVQERRLDLDYLRKSDLCPIKYLRVCKATGEEVPYKDIVRGYQYQKGRYVVLEEDDLKRAAAKKTQAIEIIEFTPVGEIGLKLLEKPYYIEPARESQKAYAILRDALKKTGRAGIARFVMRTREYLVALLPEKDLLVLEQLRFIEQLKNPAELDVSKSGYTEKELGIAVQLVDRLSVPFRPENYPDTYNEELKKIISQKIEGKMPEVPEETFFPTAVPDIMAKLKESLEQARKK